MTNKEKQQEKRFYKEIEPLLDQLVNLCDKYKMPVITAVQVFDSDKTGLRVCGTSSDPAEMGFQMLLSRSLLNGSTTVTIQKDNTLQLNLDVEEPAFQQYLPNKNEDDFEPLVEHAATCKDCNELLQDLILRGERVDNVVVPKHGQELENLIHDIQESKLPFIAPTKKMIIH